MFSMQRYWKIILSFFKSIYYKKILKKHYILNYEFIIRSSIFDVYQKVKKLEFELVLTKDEFDGNYEFFNLFLLDTLHQKLSSTEDHPKLNEFFDLIKHSFFTIDRESLELVQQISKDNLEKAGHYNIILRKKQNKNLPMKLLKVQFNPKFLHNEKHGTAFVGMSFDDINVSFNIKKVIL